LCEYCARDKQGLWFDQDRGGREGTRNLLGTREHLTGAVVRVRGSHAETGREEEGGDRYGRREAIARLYTVGRV
jgi:DNA primase